MVKQYKTLLWISAFCLFSTSCSEDEQTRTANSDETLLTKGLTVFAANTNQDVDKKETTRQKTSMDQQGQFFWTNKDHLWVQVDNMFLRDSINNIVDTQNNALFYYSSKLQKQNYNVYYVGQNSSIASKTESNTISVTIPSAQSQARPNNSKHLAKSGDCGFATATKDLNGVYNFNLTHKAAYLIITPKIQTELDNTGVVLKSIKIESNNYLAGTYDFSTGELSSSKATGLSRTITFTPGGSGGEDFILSGAYNIDQNGMYVVIQPGTHTLKLSYTIEAYGKLTQTYVKEIPSHEFVSNRFYNIGHTLPILVHDEEYTFSNTYFMWDAKKWYWDGYTNFSTPSNNHLNYNQYLRAQADDPDRWYNTVAAPAEGENSCVDMPNANEISWYITYGDPYLDENTMWVIDGDMYHHGLWLKRKAAIIRDNPNVPNLFSKEIGSNGKDARITSGFDVRTSQHGNGRPANIEDYFYLPALDRYVNGKISGFTTYGYYWTSTQAYNNSKIAINFYFTRGNINVNAVSGYDEKNNGFVAGHRPDGSNWFQ